MLMPQACYGVIGWPLGQSLSPLIHNTGFEILKIPAVYFKWPVAPPQLATFINALSVLNIPGVSVTIPHKITVMEYVENLTEAAALAGAVNTLFYRDKTLCGDNTDVQGFLSPLAGLQLDHMDTLLIGAGGAAHAAGAALRLAGCPNVRVTSPGNMRQYPLAERFGFTGIPWDERYSHPARLIINATPLGMHGALINDTPYDFAKGPQVQTGFAYDLVYNPRQTRFLREAAQHGRKPIFGIEMFWGQGNAQFKLWTGHDLPPEARIELEKTLGACK